MARPCPPVVARRLDDSRILLPLETRQQLGDGVVLYADPAGCIGVMLRPTDWERLLPDLHQCAAHDETARALFHVFAATGVLVRVDGRGRFVLPELHMHFAGLELGDEVRVVTVGAGLQIWEPGRLTAHLRAATSRLRELHVRLFRQQLPLVDDLLPQLPIYRRRAAEPPDA